MENGTLRIIESLKFIESEAEYRDALRRLEILREAGSAEAREEVEVLTGLINLYKNPMSPKESASLTETIQRLIDEGALKGTEDDVIW